MQELDRSPAADEAGDEGEGDIAWMKVMRHILT